MNCEKCSQPLPPGALFCSRCGAAAHASDTQGTPKAGRVLEEKWRLERKIGEGGMGAVYLAHDLVLDRKVAIKLLADALIHDAELVGRFEREARLTAGLEHPNIVSVYAVGRDGDRPFMVMKHLEGVALSSYLRSRGTLNGDELLPLLRQIAAGLDFIHARGFVHRDIKTGNIFVGPTGHATLLDFGIVRPSRGAEAITRTGMVMGTPQYMSPEQALGIRDIDHRADLYALAVVLFECLTGQLPFDADSDLKLVQLQAHATPPDVRSLAPRLPQLLSRVMARALAKRPEDRFPSAQDLYAAVEAGFGLRFLTGPSGVPVMQAGFPIQLDPTPPVAADAGFPIPLEPTPPVAAAPSFPIPLEPTPPAPGESLPVQQPVGSPTRASRPSALAEPVPKAPPLARRRGRIALAGVALAALAAAAGVVFFGGDGEARAAVGALPIAAAAADADADADVDADAGPAEEEATGEVTEAAVPALEEDAGDAVELADLSEPPEAAVEFAPLDVREPPPTAAAKPEARPAAAPRRPRPAMGRINVVTTFKGGPYWASILINGERRGTTPALLELPAGRHRLRLERAGFKPIEKQIRVASGRSAVVRIELVP